MSTTNNYDSAPVLVWYPLPDADPQDRRTWCGYLARS
jgi:hypothetical protein